MVDRCHGSSLFRAVRIVGEARRWVKLRWFFGAGSSVVAAADLAQRQHADALRFTVALFICDVHREGTTCPRANG